MFQYLNTILSNTMAIIILCIKAGNVNINHHHLKKMLGLTIKNTMLKKQE